MLYLLLVDVVLPGQQISISVPFTTNVEELLGGSLQSKTLEYTAPQLCLELPANLVNSPTLPLPILEHVAAFFFATGALALLIAWLPLDINCGDLLQG